jgi:hypothetical protein
MSIDILEKLKLLEATAVDLEPIDPDDLYFCKHIPTGKVLKKSFKETLQDTDNMQVMSKSNRLELINHWNRLASSHQPVTYLYWI